MAFNKNGKMYCTTENKCFPKAFFIICISRWPSCSFIADTNLVITDLINDTYKPTVLPVNKTKKKSENTIRHTSIFLLR